MSDIPEEEHQVSYWPSVSDLFMTLFIIIVAALGAVFYVLMPNHSGNDRKVVVAVGGTEMGKIRKPVNAMRDVVGVRPSLRETQQPSEVVAGLQETANDVVEHFRSIPDVVALQRQNAALTAQFEQLKSELKMARSDAERAAGDIAKLQTALNDKPPIIRIDEASKVYRFPSGSAEMSVEFTDALTKREFQLLAEEIKRRNAGEIQGVDTIEIIGHTDGRPLAGAGNLDEALPTFLSSVRSTISGLRAGSNNDLGLLRALSVRRAWEQFVETYAERNELVRIGVRCYSAGQTLPEGFNAGDPKSYQLKEERLRRIEMRLTKLADTPPAPSQ